ncbi:MAG TPA: long-chain fatty acid--CoA ligase [Thermoanaerobaculaceae bacterium]|nr:long-chain fatty acid--CoA ligase [Thermoanaerobaculaceae bacterium]HPS77833.1 long-chain fatty acid--CoA ligase [Thermoanaerobaculaceae bacterium]
MSARSTCPLLRRFFLLAALDPQQPALLGSQGDVLATRGQLASRIAGLTETLAPFLPAGRPVALSLPNGPDLVTAFGAIRALGLPAALVDAGAPAAELAQAADAVGATAILAGIGRLGSARPVWDSAVAALGLRDRLEAVGVPTGTALLKLTSGSTGTPRAIAVGARELATDSVNIMHTMDVRPDDATLAAIPLTHSYGIGSCLVPLFLTGLPLAFPTSSLPPAIAETLTRGRVAHFPAVPAHIRALASLDDHLPPLPDLRVCLTAGAPLAPADAQAFETLTGHRVNVFYGSSECGAITYETGPPSLRGSGQVGRAMRGVRVEVVDEAFNPLPPGLEGRVLVRSGAVARGTVPAHDRGGLIGGGRFLAGDSGVFDEAGCLTLTGRVAELLNVAGKKVHPDEVRRVLEAIPGIRAAVVTGLPDVHRGQLVAAVVEVDRAAGLTVPAILAACRRVLAPHKLPRRLVLVDEMPTSERGKVRKDAVLALLSRPNDPGSGVQGPGSGSVPPL